MSAHRALPALATEQAAVARQVDDDVAGVLGAGVGHRVAVLRTAALVSFGYRSSDAFPVVALGDPHQGVPADAPLPLPN